MFASRGGGSSSRALPALREQRGIDFVVANGENAADGVGITSRIARRLLEAAGWT